MMIAMAMSCNPALILADEPTTALDVTIQAQILELMKGLSRRLGAAMLMITHNLGVVARYADRVNVMYAGKIVERGTAREIYANPRHPYTLGLLRSVPRLDEPRRSKLEPIPGQPPDLSRLPGGCSFAPRCPYVIERCRVDAPSLEPVGAEHLASCWVASELGKAVPCVTDELILEVRDLVKHFEIGGGLLGGAPSVVKAVDGVSFSIRRGETLGLVGESGCGKTTTGRCILQLERPTSGQIRLRGPRADGPRSGRAARGAAANAGHLPGSVQLAEPAHDGGPDHRRAPRRAPDRPGAARP